MDDEVLAGAASLIGMVFAGVDERLGDAVTIDHRGGVVGVLLDDREQIRQQATLELVEVSEQAELGRVQLRRGDRRAGATAAAIAAVAVARTADAFASRVDRGGGSRLGGGQTAALGWVLRNRRPSS
jgi:hypothetical protein